MNKGGFTLIELLIVVAIVSITMGVGLPSFQSIIASSRLTSATNAMVSALQLARAEALKQHKSVAIISQGTGWETGWIVFVDLNSSNITGYQPVQDADEPTIAKFDALSPSITSPVGTGKGTYSSHVRYKGNGRVNDAGHFAFCSATEFRKVIIAPTGRIRLETPTSCS